MYDTLSGAAIAAKRVKQKLAITRSHAQEIVARAAGYQDWHHLTTLVGSGRATTGEGRTAILSAYLAAIGLSHVAVDEALEAARPDKALYYLRPTGLDPDFYPFRDIRPFLDRDIERVRTAIESSTIIDSEGPDPDTDDDVELDRATHFMELRRYALKGDIPDDMTASGHLMAMSEYYSSTYWSLVPSDTAFAPVSLGIEGGPDATRDPMLAVRTWRRVVEDLVVEMPKQIEAAYEEACRRIADKLRPMLPAGKIFSVRIDALRKVSVEIATNGFGRTMDQIYEGYDVDPSFGPAELAGLPRAFFVSERFTNQHLVFPEEGVTYRTDMPLDATVYTIDEREMEFTNSRSYSLDAHSAKIDVEGLGIVEPGPGAPLRKRVNRWAHVPIDLDSVTITTL